MLFPRIEGGKVVSMKGRTTFGEEFDRLVDESKEVSGDIAIMGSALGIAAFLLLRNYDLTDLELQELLTLRVDSKETWESVFKILYTAWGIGPKQSTAGEESQ